MKKSKLVIIISASVVALIGIIAGVFLGITSNTPAHEVTKQNSFKEMSELLTNEKELPPTSMVVTPSTQEWWDRMFPFRGSLQYERVSYKALEKDSTRIIFSNSSPESYEAYDVFQMPTVTLVYKTPEAAKTALEALNANSDYAGALNVQNLVILHPEASYAGSELNPGALKRGLSESDFKSWGVSDENAYWYLNLSAFKDSYVKTIPLEEDQTVFTELAKEMGVGENTYWVGSSANAEDWKGRFYGLDLKNFSPTEINGFLAAQALALQTDGKWIRGEEGLMAGTYAGIVESAQALLNQFSSFATKDKAVGSVFTFGQEEPEALKPLKKSSPYHAQILIDPNAWVGYLQGQGAQANRVLYASSANILVGLDGSAEIKLDLITRDEYIQSIEDERKAEAEADSSPSGYDEENTQVDAEPDTGTDVNMEPLVDGQ